MLSSSPARRGTGYRRPRGSFFRAAGHQGNRPGDSGPTRIDTHLADLPRYVEQFGAVRNRNESQLWISVGHVQLYQWSGVDHSGHARRKSISFRWAAIREPDQFDDPSLYWRGDDQSFFRGLQLENEGWHHMGLRVAVIRGSHCLHERYRRFERKHHNTAAWKLH